MELIKPEVLKKILVQSGESDDVESVLSSESEAALGHGENFCSNIVRIHLKLKLTSGNIFEKTLILKVFLKNLDEEAQEEMKELFLNEATMYNKILVRLGDLAEMHNLNHPKLWPNCYLANTDVVIFDDLKEAGFVVPPRQEGLKLEEALRVLRFVGQFHALSVVAKRRQLIDPLVIRKINSWAQIDNFSSVLLDKLFSTVGDIIMQWGGEWEDPGRKIIAYADKMSRKLYDLCKEDVEFRVVNHGDLWINNFMVKYNEDKYESLRFVDFQNSTYNSIGWDLVYFLYSSLQGQLMRSNYDKLLSSYRDAFIDTLQRLGEDPCLAPSMDHIKDDIVRLHPVCLAMTCTLLATVFNVSNTPAARIDEMFNDDFKLRSSFTSDNWKSSIKVHIKYFQEHNVL